jgi:hypothetical protein
MGAPEMTTFFMLMWMASGMASVSFMLWSLPMRIHILYQRTSDAHQQRYLEEVSRRFARVTTGPGLPGLYLVGALLGFILVGFLLAMELWLIVRDNR